MYIKLCNKKTIKLDRNKTQHRAIVDNSGLVCQSLIFGVSIALPSYDC